MPNADPAPCSLVKRVNVILSAQLAVIGLAVSGASRAATSAPKKAPAVLDLQRYSQRFEQLAQNHELGRMGAFYAANALMKPACSPMIQGRTKLLESWKDLFARRQFSPSFRTRDFDVSSDGKIAIERGRAQFLENVGGVPYGSNFEYTRVWHKVGRRDWQIATDIAFAADTCDDDDEDGV